MTRYAQIFVGFCGAKCNMSKHCVGPFSACSMSECCTYVRGSFTIALCVNPWAGDLERSLEDLEALSCAATSGSGRGIGQGMFGLIRCYIAFLKALGHGSRRQAEVCPSSGHELVSSVPMVHH